MHDFLIGALPVAPLVAFKRPKIESGNYEADFPLQLMWKDLHLAALTAYEQGVPLPVANVTKEIYAAAARSGFADQDVAAVYRFVNGEDLGDANEESRSGELNIG
jgi:3-hydroxyisobutyrate dehydrogenase-like beta-hydroxyacid dehydrogenase